MDNIDFGQSVASTYEAQFNPCSSSASDLHIQNPEFLEASVPTQFNEEIASELQANMGTADMSSVPVEQPLECVLNQSANAENDLSLDQRFYQLPFHTHNKSWNNAANSIQGARFIDESQSMLPLQSDENSIDSQEGYSLPLAQPPPNHFQGNMIVPDIVQDARQEYSMRTFNSSQASTTKTPFVGNTTLPTAQNAHQELSPILRCGNQQLARSQTCGLENTSVPEGLWDHNLGLSLLPCSPSSSINKQMLPVLNKASLLQDTSRKFLSIL